MHIMVCTCRQVDVRDTFTVTEEVSDPSPFGLVDITDPASLAALALARGSVPGATVTAVAIGPSGADRALRDSLAAGADAAVRVDVPESVPLTAQTVCELLAEQAVALEADLVVAGDADLESALGFVGPATAEQLGWPHVGPVVDLERSETGLTVLRKVGFGERERVAVALPCLVTVGAQTADPAEPDLPRLIATETTDIRVVQPGGRPPAARRGPPPVRYVPPRVRAKVDDSAAGLSPAEQMRLAAGGGAPRSAGSGRAEREVVDGDPASAARAALAALQAAGLVAR